MEAAGPLTRGQLESLGGCAGQAHAEAGGEGHPLAAVAVQPTLVVG